MLGGAVANWGALPAALSGGWKFFTVVLHAQFRHLEMLQAAKQVNGLQHARWRFPLSPPSTVDHICFQVADSLMGQEDQDCHQLILFPIQICPLVFMISCCI